MNCCEGIVHKVSLVVSILVILGNGLCIPTYGIRGDENLILEGNSHSTNSFLLTVRAISADDDADLNVLFNLTGLALWKTYVEILQQTNFSISSGEYTIYAPERFEGYKFAYWLDGKTGRLLGTSSSLTLSITEATNLLAVYRAEREAVTVDPALIFLVGLFLVGGLILYRWIKNVKSKLGSRFKVRFTGDNVGD